MKDFIFICTIFSSLTCIKAFVTDSYRSYESSRRTIGDTDDNLFAKALYAANKDEYSHPKKKGYQFGDITKTLITKVTKKDKYEFGDLSRSLDKAAKDKIADLSGNSSYEFGDFSKYIDKQIKEQAKDFTKKDKYKFGDVSKEIIRRVQTRDYALDDMIILFKILLAFGAGLSPVANFLPAKLLIELLDYSIVGDLSNKLIHAITSELDRRMKKAFTGDEDYKLGDMSKKAMLNYIGKEEYTFGDISKFVMDSVEEKKTKERDQKSGTMSTALVAKESKAEEKSLLKSMDSEQIAKELEAWDTKFLKDIESDKSTKS